MWRVLAEVIDASKDTARMRRLAFPHIGILIALASFECDKRSSVPAHPSAGFRKYLDFNGFLVALTGIEPVFKP